MNTATSAQTALAQLQGTVQRGVLDAQRETVSYNASREGVRAVYRSAMSAVRGHDNCRCLAVPDRPRHDGVHVAAAGAGGRGEVRRDAPAARCRRRCHVAR